MALSGNYSLVDLPRELLEKELYPQVISLKSIQVVMTLAETCKMLYQLFQPQLDQYAAEKLISYILQSEPEQSKKETFNNYNSYFIIYSHLNIDFTPPVVIPPKEQVIGYEKAKKMIAANPKLIFTEDIEKKYSHLSNENSVGRHMPYTIASNKNWKLSLFMNEVLNKNILTSQTDQVDVEPDIKTNSDTPESANFKYDFSVD